MKKNKKKSNLEVTELAETDQDKTADITTSKNKSKVSDNSLNYVKNTRESHMFE